MQALKDVMGRAEEQRNLRSLLWCTLLVVTLVTLVFGVNEFRLLFEIDRSDDSGESSAAILTEDSGG